MGREIRSHRVHWAWVVLYPMGFWWDCYSDWVVIIQGDLAQDQTPAYVYIRRLAQDHYSYRISPTRGFILMFLRSYSLHLVFKMSSVIKYKDCGPGLYCRRCPTVHIELWLPKRRSVPSLYILVSLCQRRRPCLRSESTRIITIVRTQTCPEVATTSISVNASRNESI